MSMLDGEWAKAVGAEFKKPYYRDLYNFVRDEYATHVVLSLIHISEPTRH